LVGDGVAVPVVAHINENILLPVFDANVRQKVQSSIGA
jgi:hypothetical protein